MKKISACPSWLDLTVDRLGFVYVPERAKIIRRMFELSIEGLGSYSIARHLDRQKVPPFGPSKTWDPSSIDSILRSRAVLGEYQPKSYAGGNKKGVPVGNPVQDYYPAIIDNKTFEAAQQARKLHLAVGRGRKGNDLANLFNGLTSCVYCGAPVKFHSNGDAKTLICSTVLDRGPCIRAGWSYRNFEDSVLCFLTHPALVRGYKSTERDVLEALMLRTKEMSGEEAHDARLAAASLLRKAISLLKVASAGDSAHPTHPDSVIRRDRPERYFQIQLWGGYLYQGTPVP